MFAIFFYPSASAAVRCDSASLGQALSRLWSWWISKEFEAGILQLPLRQNKWWLQVLWEQRLLSEIALLKVQIAVESFGLCSTDELCVCSCGAGQWCGACGSCLCVPAGSFWAAGLGFGVLWLLTRAPLSSGHLGFGPGLINLTGAVLAGS